MSKTSSTTDDPFEVWRQYLNKAERDWNSYFNDVMGSDAFSQVMGTWMTSLLTAQKTLGETFERHLAGINIPTRSDVVEIGERLTRIEDRLRRIEAATTRPAERPRRPTPPRTRTPPAPAKEAAGRSGAAQKSAARKK